MDRLTQTGILILALVVLIGWLGGGRKWAFRTMLSALVLAGLVLAGILLYGYRTDRTAERRTQKIHDCAIAKVATARCVPGQRSPEAAVGSHAPVTLDFSNAQPIEPDGWRDHKPPTARSSGGSTDPWQKYAEKKGKAEAPRVVIWPDVCPAYMLFDNPTLEQENAAVAAAEEECTSEIDPKQKSIHAQISEYKRGHKITEQVTSALDYDALAKKNGGGVEMLSAKACAAKVRTFYPGAYDDLDDATLTRKVLAKYPDYCDVTSSPPEFIPDIKGIR